jgi:hypothetical protein
MPQTPPPEINAEYQNTAWERGLGRLVRVPLTLGLVVAPVAMLWFRTEMLTLLFVAPMCLLVAALVWFGLSKSSMSDRYTVTADRIIKETDSSRQELALTAISGYRIFKQTLTLYQKEGGWQFMSLGVSANGSFGQLRDWIKAEYPDLDAQEAAANAVALLQSEELGPTAELRTATLGTARRVANWLNFAGWLTVPLLYCFSAPGYWPLVALAVIALIPVALWVFPGALRIQERKGSAYPILTSAFWLPLLVVFGHTFLRGEQLEVEPLYGLAGLIALGYAGALLIGSRRVIARRESMVDLFFTIALRSVLYGLVATYFLNRELDTSAITYRVPVVDKHRTYGKSAEFCLTVAPWGPRRRNGDLKVSLRYYDLKNPGDTVTVALHPGWLGAPWFMVPGS